MDAVHAHEGMFLVAVPVSLPVPIPNAGEGLAAAGCAARAAPCPHQVFLLGPVWLSLRELDALQGHVQEQDLSVSKEHEIWVLFYGV